VDLAPSVPVPALSLSPPHPMPKAEMRGASQPVRVLVGEDRPVENYALRPDASLAWGKREGVADGASTTNLARHDRHSFAGRKKHWRRRGRWLGEDFLTSA
jgi:hypothetical protein